jgi:hypothetical protein
MSSQSLVERITQYVDDRTLIRRHGSQAREFSMGFSAEAFRQNLQSLLKSILTERCGSTTSDRRGGTRPISVD